MGLNLTHQPGQTPLDEDDMAGLLIEGITTQQALDEVEQRGIEETLRWTMERRKRFMPEEIFSEVFIRELHRRMFGSVWKWAGTFRTTNKNIGVDKYQVGIELKMLLDDVGYWLENQTFSIDEIAIRFKHRLVSIHCFPNGNGRHARLMADVVVEKVGLREVFSWGAHQSAGTDIRTTYLAAIRDADAGDIQPLLLFARS